MRILCLDWPDCMVTTRQTGVCSVIRFECSKTDDSKILHVLDEVLKSCEFLACQYMSLYSDGELNIMQRAYTSV